MNFIIVGVGGAIGSLVRYQLGKLISSNTKSTFPIGTFIINISGAVLLGAVTSINPGSNLILLLCDGFLGAYTTFSTFMYEGFNLLKDREKLNAIVYIILSFLLGIAGYSAGFFITGLIIK